MHDIVETCRGPQPQDETLMPNLTQILATKTDIHIELEEVNCRLLGHKRKTSTISLSSRGVESPPAATSHSSLHFEYTKCQSTSLANIGTRY